MAKRIKCIKDRSPQKVCDRVNEAGAKPVAFVPYRNSVVAFYWSDEAEPAAKGGQAKGGDEGKAQNEEPKPAAKGGQAKNRGK